MTEALSQGYISTDRFQRDLGTYRIFLETQGKSPETVDRYVSYAKHCVKTLGGDVEPEVSGERAVTELKDAFDGLAVVTGQRYLNAWNLFVRAVRAGRSDDGRVPYRITERFEQDLAGFRARLLETGSSPGSADKGVRYVKHCWNLITEYIGNLYPEDVDEDVISELEWRMADMTDGNRGVNLRTLGRFVAFVTGGDDPYRVLNRPDRQTVYSNHVRTQVEGNPFECELVAYIASLESDGMSDRTVLNKVAGCRIIIGMLMESGWKGELEDILPVDIKYLRNSNVGEGAVKESTLRAYLSSFGCFVEFFTGFNPVTAASIRWNSNEGVNRLFITFEDFERLKGAADEEGMLILALAGGMGLRRAEISNILLTDIGPDTLRIHGKGAGPNGTTYTVPLHPSIRRIIEDYLPVREAVLKKFGDHSEGHLMVRRYAYGGEPLPPDSVGDIIMRLGTKAGVKVTVHSLRRLYAMGLKDMGLDVKDMQVMMRHAYASTTIDCYLMADPRNRSKAADAIANRLF